MSLIAWWPLTEHLEDYSLYKRGSVTSSWTVDGSGKIGKCRKKSGNINFPINQSQVGDVFTLAFWIYTNPSATSSARIFGTEAPRIPMTCFQYPTRNDLHWSASPIGATDNTGLEGGTDTGVLKDSEWTHVAITYKNRVLTRYYNGVRKGSHTFSSDRIINDSRGIDTGCLDGTKMNDLRIYNHILSSREIQELAKAKIAHYKFTNPIDESTVNLHGGISYNTASKGSDYFIKTDADGWYCGAYLPYANVTKGKRYTWSLEVMCLETFDVRWDPNCTADNYSGNDLAMSSTVSHSAKYEVPGVWQKVSLSVVVQADAVNPRLHHSFCPTKAGATMKIYTRNAQLEERTMASDYTQMTRMLGLGDNSGLRNYGNNPINGIRHIENENAFYFEGTKGIPIVGTNFPTLTETISFNCWIKPEQKEGANIISLGGNAGVRFRVADASGTIWFLLNDGVNGFQHFNLSETRVTFNQWQMLTITYHKGLIKTYINGVKKQDYTAPLKKISLADSTRCIGGYSEESEVYLGYLREIAVYTTELTQTQITDLYKVKASLTKDARMFNKELVESSSVARTNAKVKKVLDFTCSGFGGARHVNFDGNSYSLGRGFSALVISKNLSSHSFRSFDTYADTHGANQMIEHLNSVNDEDYICIMSYDHIGGEGGVILQTHLTNAYGLKCRNYGKSDRSAYAAVFKKNGDKYHEHLEPETPAPAIATIKYKQTLTYDSLVDIHGRLISADFYEFNMDGIKTKEQFGAKWARLFYHNNSGGTQNFGSDKSEFLCTKGVYKISHLESTELFRGKDGKFEFLLQYQSGGNSYNRWKQTSVPFKENIAGYEAISCSWTDKYWGGLEPNQSPTTSWVDGSVNHGNWYYAIGCRQNYNGGMPAWGTIETGWVELWVKYEQRDVFKIYKNGTVKATEFIEV